MRAVLLLTALLTAALTAHAAPSVAPAPGSFAELMDLRSASRLKS